MNTIHFTKITYIGGDPNSDRSLYEINFEVKRDLDWQPKWTGSHIASGYDEADALEFDIVHRMNGLYPGEWEWSSGIDPYPSPGRGIGYEIGSTIMTEAGPATIDAAFYNAYRNGAYISFEPGLTSHTPNVIVVRFDYPVKGEFVAFNVASNGRLTLMDHIEMSFDAAGIEACREDETERDLREYARVIGTDNLTLAAHIRGMEAAIKRLMERIEELS